MLLEGWVTTLQHPGQSEESSARQTRFTKLAVETEVESEESDARPRADTSIDGRDEVSTEAKFPRSLSPAEDLQGEDPGEVGEVGEESEVKEVLPDGRLDQPTSTENVQYNDRDMHSDEHPVINRDVESAVIKGATGYDSKEPDTDLEEPDRPAQQTAGPGLKEPDGDYGASNVDTIDQDGSTDSFESEGEEVLYRETQIAPTQDATEYVSTETADTDEWDNARQRPTRTTRRPTRFLDRDFETQFRPEERKKRCSRLGRGEPARQEDDKLYHTYKHTRKKACFDRGREKYREKPSEKSAYQQPID